MKEAKDLRQSCETRRSFVFVGHPNRGCQEQEELRGKAVSTKEENKNRQRPRLSRTVSLLEEKHAGG